MSKVLVAYFSASGATAEKAKQVAEAAGADLYEIRPAKPYTEADANWKNPVARCNREWATKKKIELADTDAKVEQYDTILLGYPIWYNTAPLVIRSFLSAYDFSGKRIIPFATSGGSTLKRSVGDLKKWAPGANVEDGAMVNGAGGVDALVAKL